MVQKLLLSLWGASLLFSNFAYTKEDAEGFVVEHQMPALYGITEKFVAQKSLKGDPDSTWVSSVTVLQIERSSLKALLLKYSDPNAKDRVVSQEYFLIVNEVNIPKGKDANGEVSPEAKARVELTLIHMFPPREKKNESGDPIPRVFSVSFAHSIDKPMSLYLQNDEVDVIQKWDEKGNYFIKEESEAGLPMLRVEEIKTLEKSEIPLALKPPAPSEEILANFGLRPQLMARVTTGGNENTKRAMGITVFNIEGTYLKALMVDYADKQGRNLEPELYLVVRERNIEMGKNSLGKAESGTRARILLSLVKMARPAMRRSPLGENVLRVLSADFYSSMIQIPKGPELAISLELKNNGVSRIEKWDEPGNYFYKGMADSSIPTLEIKNLIPYETPSKNNINAEELRSLFKSSRE